MKIRIRIRCNERFVTFELSVDEIRNWLDIAFIPDDTEEKFRVRAQALVDERYNRPEYNVMHKQERHKGFIEPVKDENGEEIGEFELRIRDVRDSSIFFKDEIDREKAAGYEAVEGFVYAVLKPDVAELFMDVDINCIPINEKAASMINRDEFEMEEEYQKAVARMANNITQKLKRAKQKLKKNISKASDYGICYGYQVGGQNSSNKN